AGEEQEPGDREDDPPTRPVAGAVVTEALGKHGRVLGDRGDIGIGHLGLLDGRRRTGVRRVRPGCSATAATSSAGCGVLSAPSDAVSDQVPATAGVGRVRPQGLTTDRTIANSTAAVDTMGGKMRSPTART